MVPPTAAPASTPDSPRPEQIADRIVDAILAGRIAAGQRLGEQPLADLFGVSRTLVREALARLSARGMVEVNTRRGWFVVQPSREEAREAFAARAAIESGLVLTMPGGRITKPALRKLKQHLAAEQAAIRSGDASERSYLLGDFHVCLAECAGNPLLAEIMKDLTARTTLIASLYQSNHEAAESNRDHVQIVAALEAGDSVLAARLLREHLGSVTEHLSPDAADPLAPLRAALTPQVPPQTKAAKPRTKPKKLFTDLLPSPKS